jgi:DNA-binding PadR family transcriptional regulator
MKRKEKIQMFRRFGYESTGPGNQEEWGEDWTPPWQQGRGHHHRGHHGPVEFAMRRFPGPFGGPFGPRGGSRGGERFFGRGDVKFALLELLRERSMYGYEMIKALEEKSGGFYTPSPGSIYPTLQLLEERGLVTAQEAAGKKVYTITDAGRALLDERQQEGQFSGPPWGHHRRGPWEHRGGPRPELHALRAEAMEVARLFAIAGRSAIDDPEKVAHLRSILENTRTELNNIIYGNSQSQEQSPKDSGN